MKYISLTAGAMLLASSTAMADGMSCLIDTPAYDTYSPNTCIALIFWEPSATASFRIDNVPTNYHIHWDQPGCADDLTYCSTIVYPYQPYTAEATVYDLDAGTVEEVSATAYFENGQ